MCRAPYNGFHWIARRHYIPRSTYEVATLMMAIHAGHTPAKKSGRVKLRPGEDDWMAELLKQLLRKHNQRAWRYGGVGDELVDPHGVIRDMSNTQFAMLALYYAHDCGLKIPCDKVRKAMAWTIAIQKKSVGWPYTRGGSPNGTMTTGGLVVLLTGKAMLGKFRMRGFDDSLRRGLAWLDARWTVRADPGGSMYHYLYVYHYVHGLERVGDLKPVRKVGKHDWYREGAEWLLDNQLKDGRWENSDTHPPHDLLNTCFALLVQKRATMPATTPGSKERAGPTTPGAGL